MPDINRDSNLYIYRYNRFITIYCYIIHNIKINNIIFVFLLLRTTKAPAIIQFSKKKKWFFKLIHFLIISFIVYTLGILCVKNYLAENRYDEIIIINLIISYLSEGYFVILIIVVLPILTNAYSKYIFTVEI